MAHLWLPQEVTGVLQQENQTTGVGMKTVLSYMMMESGMIIGVKDHLHLYVKKTKVSTQHWYIFNRIHTFDALPVA